MDITADDLRALGPRGKREYIEKLAQYANSLLPLYAINSPMRISHFWAQSAHECDSFRTMGEYWGPTPAQLRYEGRKDLGNTHPGDGSRYRGRGIFQLTGRANYADMSKKLGIDLVNHPEKAADPRIALQIACEYWRSHGLNELADKNDIVGITRKINGGKNGLAERRAYFIHAWKIWGDADKAPKVTKTMAQSHEGNAAIATGGLSVGGAAVAYQAGKEAVSVVTDVKQTALDAAGVFGVSGNAAMAIGLAVLVVAGCGYIWFRRRKRLIEDLA